MQKQGKPMKDFYVADEPLGFVSASAFRGGDRGFRVYGLRVYGLIV